MHSANAQSNSSFFFNEFSLSTNYTDIKDHNSEGRFGFGAGIYKSFENLLKKRTHFTFGIEYNSTSQFTKVLYDGLYSTTTNRIYTLNYISVPVTLKMSFGIKNKFFIEPGFFIELYTEAKKTGSYHHYSTSDSLITSKDFTTWTNPGTVNFGPSFGIGLKYPVGKHYFIIKLDYKFGLANLHQQYDTDLITNRYLRFMICYRI